jgi:hypothetical protein
VKSYGLSNLAARPAFRGRRRCDIAQDCISRGRRPVARAPRAALRYRLTQGVGFCLPPPLRSPTLRASARLGDSWGIHVRLCRPVRGFSVQRLAGNGAVIFAVAGGEPGLHPRGAASLQRRCVPVMRTGNPGCRARHGLHGQEAIPAQPRLPGILQVRTRGHACRNGKTAQDQAGSPAKTAQTQEAGLANPHRSATPEPRRICLPMNAASRRPDSVCSLPVKRQMAPTPG